MRRFTVVTVLASLAALAGCERAQSAETNPPGTEAPAAEVFSFAKLERPAPAPAPPVVAKRSLKGFGDPEPPMATQPVEEPEPTVALAESEADPEPVDDFEGFAKLRPVPRTAPVVASRPTSYDPPKQVDTVGSLVKFEKIGRPSFARVLRPVTFGSKLPVAPEPESDTEDVVAQGVIKDPPLVSFEKIKRPAPAAFEFEKLDRSAHQLSRPALELKAFD